MYLYSPIEGRSSRKRRSVTEQTHKARIKVTLGMTHTLTMCEALVFGAINLQAVHYPEQAMQLQQPLFHASHGPHHQGPIKAAPGSCDAQTNYNYQSYFKAPAMFPYTHSLAPPTMLITIKLITWNYSEIGPTELRIASTTTHYNYEFHQYKIFNYDT